MSRPIKKGLEYFPLDCTMSDEVNLIIADFGMTGYGVLISMFQLIYGNKGYYTEWNTRDQKLFSRKVGIDTEEVIKIITECIEWGIFNKPKFEELNILTSRRIQEHYATTTYKRARVQMDHEHLIVDVSDKKHINKGVSDISNSPTTKVSDVESVQNDEPKEIIEEVPEFDLSKDHTEALKIEKVLNINSHFEKCWAIYPVKRGKDKLTQADKDKLFKISFNDMKIAIENLKSEFDTPYIMHGRKFFKGDFKDYLPKKFISTKSVINSSNEPVVKKTQFTAHMDYNKDRTESIEEMLKRKEAARRAANN